MKSSDLKTQSKGQELVRVDRLTYSHKGNPGTIQDLSFSLEEGQILGLAGGSGSGKSSLCRLLIGMLKPDQGRVLYRGESAYDLRKKGLLNREIQMVLQNPETAFNPARTMAYSLKEVRHFSNLDQAELNWEIRRWLGEFDLEENLLQRYPDDLSGGQLQRFSILRALLLKPRLLILDEVTSMLDTLVQAQIIELLQRLKAELELTYIMVSHDLHLLAGFADQLLVMRAGRAEWQGPVDQMQESTYLNHLLQQQRLVINS